MYDLVDDSLPYEIKARHRFKWEPRDGKLSLLEMNSESFGKPESFGTKMLAYVPSDSETQLRHRFSYVYRAMALLYAPPLLFDTLSQPTELRCRTQKLTNGCMVKLLRTMAQE